MGTKVHGCCVRVSIYCHFTTIPWVGGLVAKREGFRVPCLYPAIYIYICIYKCICFFMFLFVGNGGVGVG